MILAENPILEIQNSLQVFPESLRTLADTIDLTDLTNPEAKQQAALNTYALFVGFNRWHSEASSGEGYKTLDVTFPQRFEVRTAITKLIQALLKDVDLVTAPLNIKRPS